MARQLVNGRNLSALSAGWSTFWTGKPRYITGHETERSLALRGIVWDSKEVPEHVQYNEQKMRGVSMP